MTFRFAGRRWQVAHFGKPETCLPKQSINRPPNRQCLRPIKRVVNTRFGIDAEGLVDGGGDVLGCDWIGLGISRLSVR